MWRTKFKTAAYEDTLNHITIDLINVGKVNFSGDKKKIAMKMVIRN